MTRLNDGGPAFPVMHNIDGNLVPSPRVEYMGMSLRDWFAGMALQGLLARGVSNVNLNGRSAISVTDAAYEIADAMILARGLSDGISLKDQQWTKEEMEQIKESEKHNSFLKMNRITEPKKPE